MKDPMTNPIEAMSTQLATIGDPEMTDKQLIAQSLEQMKHAISDGTAAEKSAFASAITLGHWANQAKGAMPKEEFTPWLEKNFGERSKTPASVQWVYKCIQAARAFASLPKGQRKREAILAEYGTVKKLASIVSTLENGDDPLELAPPAPKPKRGAPTKVERAAKAAAKAPKADPVDTGEGADDLAKRIRALDRREKVLDAKEARLNAHEEALNERERLLVIREAALPAGVIDASTKEAPTANAGEQALEKARAAARKPKKAPSNPLAAATSAPKAKGGTKVAKTEKTPEIAADTAAAIQEAAARAVSSSIPVKSDADKAMDQPHHGHAPEGNAEQAGGAF